MTFPLCAACEDALALVALGAAIGYGIQGEWVALGVLICIALLARFAAITLRGDW